MSDTDRALLLDLVAAQDEERYAYREMCAIAKSRPCRHPESEGYAEQTVCCRKYYGFGYYPSWCDNCKAVLPHRAKWREARQRLGLARAAVTRRGHQLMKEAQGE